MKNTNFIAIHFMGATAEQHDLLVAMLADIGFTGFEEEPNGLRAYIAQDEFNEPALAEIIKTVPVDHSQDIIPEQNWNAQWESSFEPIIVNDLVAIRAGFHEALPHVKHEIIITPKMSFGTGHHATTYLVIEQMLSLDFTGKTILDFGTGTGVLAILAEKMGAGKIMAIDNDDWSIENAKENISANGCKRIDLQKAETIPPGNTYDIIIANINLNVIIGSLPSIANSLKAGGQVILSGFLQSDVPVILESVAQNGLMIYQITHKNDWVCVYAG